MTSVSAPSNIAKGGWLLRQWTKQNENPENTSILHRWKKSYVVFYTDGRLAYFDDEKTTVAEDVIDIPRDKAIILGPEYCKDVNPPTEKSHNFLFGVKTRSKSVYFCAENEDEL
uniref:PH domain-containing protein n=1 Tax=Romanomermis culicivorax TaxID=13658 RepID=A0A915JQM9_ROMCU